MIRLISVRRVPEEEKKTVSKMTVNLPYFNNPEDSKLIMRYRLNNIKTKEDIIATPVWRKGHLTAIVDLKGNVLWEETYDWKLTDKYILEGKFIGDGKL